MFILAYSFSILGFWNDHKDILSLDGFGSSNQEQGECWWRTSIFNGFYKNHNARVAPKFQSQSRQGQVADEIRPGLSDPSLCKWLIISFRSNCTKRTELFQVAWRMPHSGRKFKGSDSVVVIVS